MKDAALSHKKYQSKFMVYLFLQISKMDDGQEKYLIKLKDSKQQVILDAIKERLSQFPKFFMDYRSNTILIYDRTCVYIISKKEHKVTDLGKTYPIVQLIYNPIKNIMVFLTSDGYLYGHFISGKTQFIIKKGIKNWLLFDWVYGLQQYVDYFQIDNAGIKFYKVEEERKNFKQVKSTSIKINSVLYDPQTQLLAIFSPSDCRVVSTFSFEEEKYKNWFKSVEIPISINNDEELQTRMKKNKSLGLKNSTNHTELFTRNPSDQYYSQLIRMNNKSYLIIYFGNQGKLKLYPITQDYSPEKQVTIKLPSDSVPFFNVVDNMLIINLRNQKITFIYDVNANGAQMLVSPFPIEHSTRKVNPYLGSFSGKRHILNEGIISKWVVNLETIYFYLKNQNLIFDFLHKRKKAKMQLLSWLRKNLLQLKQINLSRFWKLIFLKANSLIYEEGDIISIVQLYANIFYTLSCDELTPTQPLLNAVIQCFRQAYEAKVKIPFELQKLTLNLLLQCQKYDLLVFLCHNDIIRDNEEMADILVNKGIKNNSQVLLTLGMDMANRICKAETVLEYLMRSQRVREAKRYIKNNYERIDTLFIINIAKEIRSPQSQKDYVIFAKNFIQKKYPNTIDKYIEQAQQQVFND